MPAGEGGWCWSAVRPGVGKTSLVRAFGERHRVGAVLAGGCEALVHAAPARSVARHRRRGRRRAGGADRAWRVRRARCSRRWRARSAARRSSSGGSALGRRGDDRLAARARPARGEVPALLVATYRDDEVGPDHPLRACSASCAGRTGTARAAAPDVVAVGSAAGAGVDGAGAARDHGRQPVLRPRGARAAARGAPRRACATPCSPARRGSARAARGGCWRPWRVARPRAGVWLLERLAPEELPGSRRRRSRHAAAEGDGSASVTRSRVRRSRSRCRPTGASRPQPGGAARARAAATRARRGWRTTPGRPATPRRSCEHGSTRHASARRARRHREAEALLTACSRRAPARAGGAGGAARAAVRGGLLRQPSRACRVGAGARAGAAARARRAAATGATLRWLSRYRLVAGDGAAAERAAAEAVELLESFPASRELAMALSNRSQLAMLAQRDEDALRWGERAIALAQRLGDTETLVHAQTNVGATLARTTRRRARSCSRSRRAGDRRGARRARRRALCNAAWALKDVRGLRAARGSSRAAWPSARARASTSTSSTSSRARAGRPDDGRLGRRRAAAAGLVAHGGWRTRSRSQPRSSRSRAPARRRGSPRRALDEAWELARATGEMQRLRPIACARAEAAWLQGTRRGSTPRRATRLRSRSRCGHRGTSASWCCGASAAGCRPRAGACPRPIACELAGDARGAARHWAALGEPYARRSPCWARANLSRCSRGSRLLDAARRNRGRRPRARPAAPRRRRRRPARAPSRDAREPGRPDRPPAGGARARRAGTVESGDRARLFLSPKTVEHHVAAMLDKLGVRSRQRRRRRRAARHRRSSGTPRRSGELPEVAGGRAAVASGHRREGGSR